MLLCGLLFAPSIASAEEIIADTAPNIRISEIAWAGSSLSSSDEWIEIINLDDEAADLSGWTLTGALSGDDIYTFEEGSIIEPSQVLLISNYNYAHENCSLTTLPNVVTASLSLSNSKLGIDLLDDTGSLIDSAGDGGTPLAGVSGSAGATEDGRYRSMARADFTISGNLADAWLNASCQSGLIDGLSDYATPGLVGNDVCETEEVVEEISEDSTELDEEEIISNEETDIANEQIEAPTITDVIEEITEKVVEGDTEVIIENEEEAAEDTINFPAYNFGDLTINEFVSDPLEGEEWIEIVNTSSQDIDLTGCTVEDATSRQTSLPEQNLEPGAFVVVENPSGQLNNGGDTIIIRDGHQTILDEMSYGTEEIPAPEKGYALALDDGNVFQLTTALTPGEMNVIEITEVVEEETVEEDAETTEEEIVEQEEIVEDETQEEEATENIIDFPTYTFGDLTINEFVSDPLEGEEWIEIVNTSSQDIDLTGCTVEDATGRQTSLPEQNLEPGAFVVVENPSGQLNNSGDTIIIRDGHQTILDEMSYGTEEIPAPEKGYALALDDGNVFQLTTALTPGEMNVIEITEVVEEETVEEELVEVVEETISEETINEVSGEEKETKKTVEKTTFDYSKLRLSEIYPNTEGSDAIEEYIEIENYGDALINLNGITINDASGKEFTVTEDLELANVSYYTLWRTKTNIALNNLGDTVSLYAPDGTLIDELSYEKATQGMALARIDGNWSWTTKHTANETNTFAETVLVNDSKTEKSVVQSEPAPSTTYTSTTYAYSNTTNNVTVEQAKEQNDGTIVSVTGIVIATNNTLGKQFFYLTDDTGGIQIYKYDADFPEMNIGDRFEITGVLSTNRGERRIKATTIEPLNSSEVLAPAHLLFEEIGESLVGGLVRIDGIVLGRSGNTVTLEQNGLQQIVRLSSYTDIDTDLFVRGSEVRVTGILTSSNSELRLIPRSNEDIEALSVLEQDLPILPATTSTSKTNPAIYIGLITLAGLVGLALRFYFPNLKTYATRRPVGLKA